MRVVLRVIKLIIKKHEIDGKVLGFVKNVYPTCESTLLKVENCDINEK